MGRRPGHSFGGRFPTPTWGEILSEITGTAQLLQARGGPPNVSPFDLVRRKYLGLVATHTQRPTILYATAWLSNPNAPAPLVSIADDDMAVVVAGAAHNASTVARRGEMRVGIYPPGGGLITWLDMNGERPSALRGGAHQTARASGRYWKRWNPNRNCFE